jgi:hypothetical protein
VKLIHQTGVGGSWATAKVNNLVAMRKATAHIEFDAPPLHRRK